MSKEEFCARIDSLACTNRPEWVFACRDLIADFAASSACTELLNEFVRGAKATPLEISEQWRMYEFAAIVRPMWSFAFSVFHRNAAHIYSFPLNALVLITGPGTLHYARYKLPAGGLEVGVRLLEKEELSAYPGEFIEIQGSRYAYDFEVTEPVASMKFAGGFFEPIHMMFDRQSLVGTQWIVADPTMGQLISVLSAAGELRDLSSSSSISPYVAHDNHFVRWEAIRALCRVDPERGLEALKVALDDPHPHIRTAAKGTLAKHETVS